MKALRVVLALFMPIGVVAPVSGVEMPERDARCRAAGLAFGDPFTVHGRLWNGSSSGTTFSIWVIGTKRILSVRQDLPPELEEAIEPYADYLFGDFTVQAVEPETPGARRGVCVLAGANLVLQNIKTGTVTRLSPRLPSTERLGTGG